MTTHLGTPPLPQPRSLARLRAHYEIERELAALLRDSTRAQRLGQGLYSAVYDELFRRVPDHPQLTDQASPQDRSRLVAHQMQLLGPLLRPSSLLMEIGPGDCALSLHACALVRRVVAVDVSAEISRRADLPENFMLVLSDGVSVPRIDGGADVVYSHQLMEHLHPADAVDQLRNIFDAMAPGGVYVCVTPSRYSGPHDISKFFSQEAQGFHLKEYTATELIRLFRQVGFDRTEVHALIHGRYRRVPAWAVRAMEAVLAGSPAGWRRRLGSWVPARWFSTLCVLGHKA